MPETDVLGSWLSRFRSGRLHSTNPELRRKLAAILLSGGVAPESKKRGPNKRKNT
jgi:hypothetical protein